MSSLYPVALDDGTSLPNPSVSNKTNNPSLAGQQSNQNDAIKAAETKLGTGSSAPASNTLLLGTGAGTSSWTALTSSQLASVLSDETGTGSAVFATTPTLVTPKVDTINEATGGNGTTIGGVNIKSGALVTSNSVVTANITDSAVTSAKVATGMPVQVVDTNYSAVATGTTVIPFDDTIPQITEGTEFMTQAITPKSATNILDIETIMMCSDSASGELIIALFQDATTNALAANSSYQATATGRTILTLRHKVVAGTTSSTTFRIRAGCESAGTFTFNGVGGARRYGGVTVSNIRIMEYKA